MSQMMPRVVMSIQLYTNEKSIYSFQKSGKLNQLVWIGSSSVMCERVERHLAGSRFTNTEKLVQERALAV